MASPGSEDRTYILSVQIQDGKGFGPDLQAVACAATFAGETKLTPYSVGRDTHVWNSTLHWRVTMDQFRRLTSLGQKDCKVVLSSKDGTKLGWFLVDVRAAKLQAQYKKGDGVWTLLTGAKKGDVPQVCVLSLFYEDRPGAFTAPDPKTSPSKARAPRRQQPASRSAAAAGDALDQQPEGPAASPGPTTGEGASGSNADAAAGSAMGPTRGNAATGAPPAKNPTAGLPNFGSPARRPEDDGPFRHFALTVDVRTFQSSKRLPLSSASVYVQAVLPAELVELVVSSGFRLPSRLAPLCSHPAVDIPRGAEGAVPNGYGTLEFTAGVVQLARVLALEPRISVEAWHKERFRADMLLGAGSVPLTPLLQGAWVDGYAPLFAVVATSVAGEMREERVQMMGMLRVVLSLEDKGPASTPGSQPASAPVPSSAQLDNASAHTGPGGISAAPVTALAARPNPYGESGGGELSVTGADISAGAAISVAHEDAELTVREMHPAPPLPPPSREEAPAQSLDPFPAAADGAAARSQQPQVLPPAHSQAPPPVLSLPPPPVLAAAPQSRQPGARAASAMPPGLSAAPEFEAAWELEVWKKAEEARWRTELRNREAQRMMVLESEWRRRERAREAEIASLKAEYLALEDKAQQVLVAAEGRERRILAAEEALLRRRKELEREHSARMAEAEAAVRRLQVECEHQLDIERDRNAELVRRVAMLEERLAASDARCLAVENEFADFRAASRSTPEAELARQLAEAREAAKAAEARAAKAAKAKQGYKEQVRKLAEQLASLQRRRHRDEDSTFARAVGTSLSLSRGRVAATLAPLPASNAPSIRVTAEEQARFAASQQQELATMRAQLQAIKAAALAQLSPSTSPRAAGEADRSGPGGATAGAVGLRGALRELATDGPDVGADLRGVDQQRPGRSERQAWEKTSSERVVAPPHSFPSSDSSGSVHGRPSDGGRPGHPRALQLQEQRAPSAAAQANILSGSSSSPADSEASAASAVARQHASNSDHGANGRQISDTGGSRGAGRWADPRVAPVGPSRSADATPQSGAHAPLAVVAAGARAGAAEHVGVVGLPTVPQHHTQQHKTYVQVTGESSGIHYSDQHNRHASPHGANEDPDVPASRPSADSGWAAGSSSAGPDSRRVRAGEEGAERAPRATAEEQRRSLADHLASASTAARFQDRDALREAWYASDSAQHGTSPPQPSASDDRPSNSWTASAAAPLERGNRQDAAVPPQLHPGPARRLWDRPVGDETFKAYEALDDARGASPQWRGPTSTANFTEHTLRSGIMDLLAEAPEGAGVDAAPGSHFPGLDGGAREPGLDLAEVQRLTRRKMELLKAGYGAQDKEVIQLDDQIHALLAEGAGLSGI